MQMFFSIIIVIDIIIIIILFFVILLLLHLFAEYCSRTSLTVRIIFSLGTKKKRDWDRSRVMLNAHILKHHHHQHCHLHSAFQFLHLNEIIKSRSKWLIKHPSSVIVCFLTRFVLYHVSYIVFPIKFYQDILRCRISLQNEQPQSILWQPAVKCKSRPPIFSNYSLLGQKLLWCWSFWMFVFQSWERS